jgi:glycosyltransferase involved in cell wall biosynthesis
MSERATVSIVIPVRDGERYLGEALDSLLAQTRPPDEIVVVDDGSADRSAAVAEERPGVRVLRREPAGPAAARNAGVAASSGALVGFLDADDLAPPVRIARQAEALERDPRLGGVIGLVEHFVSPDCPHLAADVHVPAGARPGWLVGALLARRDAITAAGSFDERLPGGETVDWLSRLRATGRPLAVLDELVLRRRIHERNETRRERATAHAGYLAVARAAIERARSAGA